MHTRSARVCFLSPWPCPALPCPALPCPALPCPALLEFELFHGGDITARRPSFIWQATRQTDPTWVDRHATRPRPAPFVSLFARLHFLSFFLFSLSFFFFFFFLPRPATRSFPVSFFLFPVSYIWRRPFPRPKVRSKWRNVACVYPLPTKWPHGAKGRQWFFTPFGGAFACSLMRFGRCPTVLKGLMGSSRHRRQ